MKIGGVVAVRGSTVEERRTARRELTRTRRLAYFVKEIRNARNGREQLVHACRFAQAVGDDMDDERRRGLAKAIAELVDERSKP